MSHSNGRTDRKLTVSSFGSNVDDDEKEEDAVWIPTFLRSGASEDSKTPKPKPWEMRASSARGAGRGRGSGWRGASIDRSRWIGESERQDLDGTGGSNTRGRGSFRSSNRRGRGSGPFSTRANSPPPADRPRLGSLVVSLKTEDLTEALTESTPTTSDVGLTGFKHITSYSWLDALSPTILVPGSPRRWSPATPRRLLRDTGVFYRDHDASRLPSHPCLPAISSLLLMPSSSSPVDIFACSNTLTNLYCFAAAVSTRSFRMLVESIGPTVHIVRREETAKIPNIQGFFHSFVAANTIWDPDVRGSAVHHRVIQHRIAGITSIVRFVSDGYLPDKVGINLTHDSIRTPLPENLSLSVDGGGANIPHSALFDLKTRSARNNFTPSDVVREYLPRLWLCQVPNFVTAFQERGLFSDVHVEDIRPALAEWESENTENLAKFAALLRKIISFAHARPDRKFEIIGEEGSGMLEVREQAEGAPSTLPEYMKEEWKAWLERSAGGDTVWKDDSDDEGSDDDNSFTASSDDEDEFNKLQWWEHRNPRDNDAPDYTACSADDCGYCGRCMY